MRDINIIKQIHSIAGDIVSFSHHGKEAPTYDINLLDEAASELGRIAWVMSQTGSTVDSELARRKTENQD